MKYIQNKILLMFLLLAMAINVGAVQEEHYKKWMNMPSEKLLDIGDRFLRIDNKTDSALVCFSIVFNRYNTNMSDEEKIISCKAAYGKWYVYFGKLFDYSKAYESLLNADEILKESKLSFPELNLGFAIFYHTLAGHSHDNTLEQKALEYCKTGYWSAYGKKDYRLLDIFFCNILLESERLENIESLDKEWNAYVKSKREGVFNYDFNVLQYKIRMLRDDKDFEGANKYADELIKKSEENGEDVRRTQIAYFLKSRILYSQGKYNAAIELLSGTEKALFENDLKDSRLEAYAFLSSCYAKLNDVTSSTKYENKYYHLKDSIINLKQMTNLNKMTFISEIKKMDNEINEMRYKQKSEITFVIISTIFSLILLFFIFLLFYKNKQLNNKNRKLYERNIELMNSEDDEIKDITKEIPQEVIADEELIMENPEVTGTESEIEKYKNSSLSAEDKKELLVKILCVMKDIEVICSVSFSAERLAQLTDSKYKYVSQVINEKYGCNFNMFLNKFRIKEACRRLSDIEHYGNYTIDAMSQSLGFKSRTTFTSSFKKIIGLTPSQYSRLAKEDIEGTKTY